MNPDDMRSKSPYEKGGQRPDRTKPNDRKKKVATSTSVTIPVYTPRVAKGLGSFTMSMQDMVNAYSRAVNNFSFTLTGVMGGTDRDTEFASLGFAAGIVRGVRSFSVDELGRLTGIHYRQVWAPGENLAECRKEDDGHTEVIDFGAHLPDCACGFYGYYDGSNDYRSSGATITAVVEGYGSTVIGSRGFRCSKARIVALHIPDDVKRSGVVARNYAEIPLFDSFLRMVQAFPAIGDEKTVKPEDDDFWTRSA